MKKFLILLLACLTVFPLLAACGKQTPPTAETTASGSQSPADTEPETDEWGRVIEPTDFDVSGLDFGGGILFAANPFMTAAICIVKAVVAGFLAALVYRALQKKINPRVSSILAAITAPVVNTGIFILMTFLFFRDTLTAWAAGTDLTLYLVTGLAGWNFLIELLLNLALVPALSAVLIKLRRTGVIR